MRDVVELVMINLKEKEVNTFDKFLERFAPCQDCGKSDENCQVCEVAKIA